MAFILNPRVDLSGMNVPHLDQYFGVWAIREDTLRSALGRIGKMDLRAHVELKQSERAEGAGDSQALSGFGDYEVTPEGVATIELTGPMMKYVSSLSGGTSTVAARRQIRQAMQDERVKAIALVIDSPGGTVSGTKDLANDVAAAAAKKPVLAYIEDLGASAAYWVASQATKISANSTAIVGSIGTYAVIADSSQQAQKKGIRMHVVRAGEFKGMGVDGTAVTDEQLAEMQRLVNALNSHFLEAVAAGREMSAKTVASLADGRVHVGAEAQTLGLIDAVQSFDEALSELTASISKKPAGPRAADNPLPLSDSEGAPVMADAPVTTPAPTPAPAAAAPIAQPVVAGPASYEELVAACPKADATFICAQLARKATVPQAKDAWTAALAEENEKLKAASTRPGVTGVTDRLPTAGPKAGEGAADAIAAWNEAVDAKLKACGNDRAKAVRMVCREKPELHQAYIEAYNAAHAGDRKSAK